MSYSWYFHSFDFQNFKTKTLKGLGTFTPKEKKSNPEIVDIGGSVKNIPLSNEEKLQIIEKGAFDYNQLPKENWNFLDEYFITSIMSMSDTQQVSPDHAHWRVWNELSGLVELNNQHCDEIMTSLTSGGKRYNLLAKKKSFIVNLKSFFTNLTGKYNPDYIIIDPDELGGFKECLEKIFDIENDDWPEETIGEKSELTPYFLEPFQNAFINFNNNFCNAQKMNEIEKNQLNAISIFLESISNRMTEDIIEIINGKIERIEKYANNEIDIHEFTLFPDGYRINYYAFDKYENQIGWKKTLPEYCPDGFYRDRELDLGIDTENYDFDNEDDMERLEEFDIQLERVVINWFNKCWIQADGLEAKGEYIFTIHDSYNVLDLKKQKWIED